MSTNTPTDYESTDSNQPTVREAARIPDYELLDVDGATLVYSTVTEHREHLGGEVKIGRFLAGVAEVQIRLDEETYRRLQRAFLDAVDHGYSEDFETFVYNNTATTSRIVVTDEDGGEEYR